MRNAIETSPPTTISLNQVWCSSSCPVVHERVGIGNPDQNAASASVVRMNTPRIPQKTYLLTSLLFSGWSGTAVDPSTIGEAVTSTGRASRTSASFIAIGSPFGSPLGYPKSPSSTSGWAVPSRYEAVSDPDRAARPRRQVRAGDREDRRHRRRGRRAGDRRAARRRAAPGGLAVDQVAQPRDLFL